MFYKVEHDPISYAVCFVAYKIKIMKLKKKIQLSLIGCPVFLYLFPFLFKPDIAQSALFW